jgi:thiol-disulfide isomerase/thioredoxin
MSNLINFYGKECPHCHKMAPLIKALEAQTGVTVDRLEVWYDEDNMKKLTSLDKEGLCGGVPYFYNTDTGASICGEATLEELVAWAGK